MTFSRANATNCFNKIENVKFTNEKKTFNESQKIYKLAEKFVLDFNLFNLNK